MATPDPAEDRLRSRLARYGGALEQAAEVPAPRRPHLVVVDGPVPSRRQRPPRSTVVVRVAAAVLVLLVVGGTAWTATRSRSTPTTTAGPTAAGRDWVDDDVVRPGDRAAAFAALDGSWPLPTGGSLRFVLDRPTAASTTFAGFRSQLADSASCLWFRHALERPELSAADREAIAAIPTWPGYQQGSGLQEVVDAALAGDTDRLRRHLEVSCAGSGQGLGRPELGGTWMRPGGTVAPEGAPSTPGGSATVIRPDEVRGWAAITERLGPDVAATSAVALPGGGANVALSGRGPDLSLTISRLDGTITLPVTDAAFAAGHVPQHDGVEVYAGPVEDGTTLVVAVGRDGQAVTLGADAPPEEVAAGLGDLVDLAAALHVAAWPR